MSNHNWLLFQRKLFHLLPIIFLKSSDLVHVVEMYWTISKQSLILLQLFRRELGLHALITIFNIVEFHLVSLSYEYSLTCVWVSSFCNKTGSKRAAKTIHMHSCTLLEIKSVKQVLWAPNQGVSKAGSYWRL